MPCAPSLRQGQKISATDTSQEFRLPPRLRQPSAPHRAVVTRDCPVRVRGRRSRGCIPTNRVAVYMVGGRNPRRHYRELHGEAVAAASVAFGAEATHVGIPPAILWRPASSRGGRPRVRRLLYMPALAAVRRGDHKNDRTQEYLRQWSGGEGVLYIGKAQEKARVLRTERRRRLAVLGATRGFTTLTPLAGQSTK